MGMHGQSWQLFKTDVSQDQRAISPFFSGVVKQLPPEIVKEARPTPVCELSPAEVPEVHLYPWHESWMHETGCPATPPLASALPTF